MPLPAASQARATRNRDSVPPKSPCVSIRCPSHAWGQMAGSPLKRRLKGKHPAKAAMGEQVMQRLGVRTFKVDPSRSEIDWKEVEKYGITGTAERQDDKTGPYCHEDYCNIPSGIFVSDNKFPVKVFVALKDDMIYAIEMSFNTIFWNDIWSIIVEKYGPAWEIERDTIGVMDYETKKVDQFERVIATHKFVGTNPHTNDTCSLSATNIDIIFEHHDSLGTLHAIFAIKRKAKDF
jgi:hypothetical protein